MRGTAQKHMVAESTGRHKENREGMATAEEHSTGQRALVDGICLLEVQRFRIKYVITLQTPPLTDYTYPELIHCSLDPLEQLIGLQVAGVEAHSIAVDDCREDEVLCGLTHTLEDVGNADELLHFTEVLPLHLLQWGTELQLTLSSTEKMFLVSHTRCSDSVIDNIVVKIIVLDFCFSLFWKTNPNLYIGCCL